MTDLMELGVRLAHAEKVVPRDSLWTHYKGAAVVVLNHGLDEQTGEAVVEYRHTCDGIRWHRPLSSWLAFVRVESGGMVPRFVRQDEGER